jgi:hypothetical protein
MRATTRAISIPAAILLACAGCLAQSNSAARNSAANPPSAVDSLSHDHHEGLTVSADAYADAERAKKKFGKASPVQVGILPVEVFLQNETNQPIHIDLTTIQLTVRPPGSSEQDVDSLSVREVAGEVAHPNGPAAPKARRFPIGVPSASDSKTDKMLNVLRPLSLDSDLVPPMGQIHGFLFFDLSRDMSLARNASLYIPDVTVAPSKKALMFFEVTLNKAGEE